MIILINPNATETMTLSMQATAQSIFKDRLVEGWTSHDGPPSIQGAADGDLAVPPMLDLVRNASDKGAQAIIIGCFDDTGLDQAKALADCPVIGIGQAAYHMAAMAGGGFSVVTTLAVSIPVLEDNLKAYRLTHHLGRVRASGVPVLEIETEPARAEQRIIAEIQRAEAEDGIRNVVLGCGGMVTLLQNARKETGLRVIDGVQSAATIASGLV